MVNKLKRLNPQLSKLAAQVIYERHRDEAAREVRQLRDTLAELIRRGCTSDELIAALKTGDPHRFVTASTVIAPCKHEANKTTEFSGSNAHVHARQEGSRHG